MFPTAGNHLHSCVVAVQKPVLVLVTVVVGASAFVEARRVVSYASVEAVALKTMIVKIAYPTRMKD